MSEKIKNGIYETSLKKESKAIEEGVLFSGSSTVEEKINYTEPLRKKGSSDFEALFNDKDVLSEEKLKFSEPEKKYVITNGINAEPLFKSGVEELDVTEENSLKEETLDFAEPIKPNFICEEALFKDTDGEAIQQSIFDSFEMVSSESVVPDEIAASLSVKAEDFEEEVYIQKNFAEKMAVADEIIQLRYNELRNYILRYKHVKGRISNKFDSFNQGRTQLYKLSVAGKTLKLYLNLDFSEVEPRLKCRDVSKKVSYKEVPVYLPVKSDRAVRNAKYLIDKVAEKFGLKENVKFEKTNAMNLIEEKIK